MGLPKRISTFYIRNKGYTGGAGDWQYHFTVNNADISLGQVNFNSATDEAIDGTLRSNLRGVRLELSLSWNKLYDSSVTIPDGSDSTVEAFINSMIDSIATDGDEYVEFTYDNLNWGNEWNKIVPDDTSITNAYNNQIGVSSGNLNFKGYKITTVIIDLLQGPS